MIATDLTDPTTFSYPVLIGDIGGTNARFALVVDSNAAPRHFDSLETEGYETVNEAIQAGVMNKTSLLPRTAILAVAGPVEGDAIELTNNDWVVRPQELIEEFDLEEVIVLNDFEAQALSLSALKPDDIEPLTENETDPFGPKVILGPGTGLGVAALVNAKGVWLPIPGEGGHIDLAPVTDRDTQYWPHLERIEGRVSAEEVICGRGLLNLYKALCKADDVTPKYTKPSEISDAAIKDTDSLADETLDIFAQHLGRVAGNLALIFMASGGVFLTGGISQKIIEVLRNGNLISAFNDKAPHNQLMSEMPVSVVMHPLAPILGLAAYAHAPSRFGMKTGHRRWVKPPVDHAA